MFSAVCQHETPPKKASNAASPPAEAPMPTTGKAAGTGGGAIDEAITGASCAGCAGSTAGHEDARDCIEDVTMPTLTG